MKVKYIFLLHVDDIVALLTDKYVAHGERLF